MIVLFWQAIQYNVVLKYGIKPLISPIIKAAGKVLSNCDTGMVFRMVFV